MSYDDDLEERVREFNETQRQWKRQQRIEHARYQIEAAGPEQMASKEFWQSVLAKLED